MNDDKWFESWFDSPYYHLLYAHRDEEEARSFLSRLSEHLHIPEGAVILDAACGKGRHAITLASMGFRVEGIDLSCRNISEAKKQEHPHLHFKEWDIRKVYIENHFDYVFNLFSSFGYFKDDADDRRVIESFARNLKPGGILVLDYINSEQAVKQLKPREIIPRGDIQFHVQKKIANGFIIKTIEFLGSDGHHQFEECLKLINLRQFEEMFSAAGFELIHLYGDYELNEFQPSSSPRLIMTARRK